MVLPRVRFRAAAEAAQQEVELKEREEAFKRTPIGKLLEQSRSERLKKLKKAQAQAEGRRLMQTVKSSSNTSSGTGSTKPNRADNGSLDPQTANASSDALYKCVC